MPVTVKIQDKNRRRVAENAPPPAELGDYVVPNERSEGIKAFLVWACTLSIPCAGLASVEATRSIGAALFAWWIVSVLIYYVLVPRTVLRRLRLHGSEFEITAKKQPRIKAVLSRGSALLGLSEPEGFLTEDPAPQVRVLGSKDPYFFLVTKGACELLTPPEIDCLTLRGLIQGRQRQLARLNFVQAMAATPAALRLLVWPANYYSMLLQLSWSELANQTADRLTLLLLRDPKLLQRAILKMYSISDPIMIESEVTPEDVESYVNQAGHISVQGTEISTQYKIGSAISANAFLEERLKALNDWSKSDEYQEALQKLAEARAKHASVPPPAV